MEETVSQASIAIAPALRRLEKTMLWVHRIVAVGLLSALILGGLRLVQ